MFFVSFACLAYYARFVEPKRITVTHVTIETDKLSHAFRDLTIVQLSDIHMPKFGSYQQEIVRRVNELEPDIVLITGDILSTVRWTNKEHIPVLHRLMDEVQEFVGGLRPRLGIWAVRGNYEIVVHAEINDVVLERLRQAGVNVLCNQHQRLKFSDDSICLLGVDFHDLDQSEFSDFKTTLDADGSAFEAGFSTDNAYSHFLGPGSGDWQDYEFTGRMKYSQSQSCGIGVTLYSGFATGNDRFYRLRWLQGYGGFFLDSHNTDVQQEFTHVKPEMDTWYNFKTRTETQDHATHISARVWPERNPEPEDWQAEIVDETDTRLTHGTVGLWSWGHGTKSFDDLRVVCLSGDQVLMQQDFESYPGGSDPEDWLDHAVDAEGVRIASRGLPQDEFKILLSHSPDLIHEAADCGIDLVLSGHTHGGQVRLPLVGALLSKTRLGPRYAAGRFNFGETILYVSRGLGTVLLPIRFLCPPEITVIHLQSTRKPK